MSDLIYQPRDPRRQPQTF